MANVNNSNVYIYKPINRSESTSYFPWSYKSKQN